MVNEKDYILSDSSRSSKFELNSSQGLLRLKLNFGFTDVDFTLAGNLKSFQGIFLTEQLNHAKLGGIHI